MKNILNIKITFEQETKMCPRVIFGKGDRYEKNENNWNDINNSDIF